MNIFRTISRLLVVATVISVSSATAYLDQLVKLVDKALENPGARTAVGNAMGLAGGLLLKEELAKKNPHAVAIVTGLGLGILDGTKAGVIATGTGLAISGVRAFSPEIGIVNSVTDTLPKCLTSKDAKLAAQIAVSVAIGHYFGREK